MVFILHKVENKYRIYEDNEEVSVIDFITAINRKKSKTIEIVNIKTK